MIARHEQAAAALTETGDTLAVGCGQALTYVHREEPELIEVGAIESAQNGVAVDPDPVARGHREERRAGVVGLLLKERFQQREAADVPIFRDVLNRCLQKNLDRRSSG